MTPELRDQIQRSPFTLLLDTTLTNLRGRSFALVAESSNLLTCEVRVCGVRCRSGSSLDIYRVYFFPKGPLYLLSRPIAQQTLAGEWARAEHERGIASGLADPFSDEPTWPWEDVFLGAAMARSVRGSEGWRQPVAVHVGGSGFPGVLSEVWGMMAAPATLVWHPRTKGREERFHALEAFAAERKCDLAFDKLVCREYVACTGARWRACEPKLLNVLGGRRRGRNDSCEVRLENLMTREQPGGRGVRPTTRAGPLHAASTKRRVRTRRAERSRPGAGAT